MINDGKRLNNKSWNENEFKKMVIDLEYICILSTAPWPFQSPSLIREWILTRT